MKFLCDRCKTRYSIGDDRVRGKILKIRCKNCANVITVREGMTDADAAGGDAQPRRNRTTTAAPLEATQAPSGSVATPAAGAPAKPPAALEEEWYVSIDGDQEGPFSLADAQRWIGSKAPDADLHCWSEGFDDWLPVDKVSHFRGLRKKVASVVAPMPAPPPLRTPPSPGSSPAARLAAQPAPARPVEEEPKPLFAATMASLERNAPVAPAPSIPLTMPAARATPPGGVPAARTNGAPKLPTAPVPPTTPMPALGLGLGLGPVAAKGTASEPVRGPEPKNAFDVGDADDAGGVSASFAKPAPSPTSVEPDPDDDDDGLSIGEVSRVVKLADLMASSNRTKARAETAPGERPSQTAINRGPAARLSNTNMVARVGGNTGMHMRVDDPTQPADPAAVVEPVPPPPQASSRRGLFVLIGVATLLLAGVVVAVVTMTGGDDSDITTLGRNDNIDLTRPDDPRRTNPGPGSAANPFFPTQPKTNPTNPVKPKNTTVNTPTNPIGPDLVQGDRLGGEDIEAMARLQSATTQRCYMRAQRGADAIVIGDVKKLSVTIDIAPDGTVKTVGLSAHADNTLGKCLIGAIRGWKFRTSPGGTYKFSLVFSGG